MDSIGYFWNQVTAFFSTWSHIKDVFEILFWIFGGCIAWQGLQTWKKQIRGSTEYEAAKKILNGVYELRFLIKQVRSPFMYSYEMTYEGDISLLSPEEMKNAGVRAAYRKRLAPLNTARQKILLNILEAELLWGKDIKDKMYKLLGEIRMLDLALEDYLRIQEMGKAELNDPYWRVRREEVNKIVLSLSGSITEIDPKDKYALELEEKINDIEALLKPYLKF